jgi:hypothetical protein
MCERIRAASDLLSSAEEKQALLRLIEVVETAKSALDTCIEDKGYLQLLLRALNLDPLERNPLDKITNIVVLNLAELSSEGLYKLKEGSEGENRGIFERAYKIRLVAEKKAAEVQKLAAESQKRLFSGK